MDRVAELIEMTPFAQRDGRFKERWLGQLSSSSLTAGKPSILEKAALRLHHG
jgi:hypothetical protein